MHAVTINSSTFLSNRAGDGGEAVYMWYIYSAVTFDHSTFINNTADDDGGAVHAEYSSIVIASSTFINNAAVDLYHDWYWRCSEY